MRVAETEGVIRSVIQTYTLEVCGPQLYSFLGAVALKLEIDGVLREAEENLTDLLPPGFSVRIREWDAEEETTDV